MLPVLIAVFVFLFHSQVGASFLCYKCDNQTASGREFCSTQQALEKNNNEAVNNCTANANILACYVQVTYKNNTVERFIRNCAGSRVCGQNDTGSCKTSGSTVTCTSCCKGDHCNNGIGLLPPTATPTVTTGPNTTSGIHGSGIVQSPLSLLYVIVSASWLFLALHPAD